MPVKRMSNSEKEAAIVEALSALDNNTTYDALMDKMAESGNEDAITYLPELKRRVVLKAVVKSTGEGTPPEFRVWKEAE